MIYTRRYSHECNLSIQSKLNPISKSHYGRGRGCSGRTPRGHRSRSTAEGGKGPQNRECQNSEKETVIHLVARGIRLPKFAYDLEVSISISSILIHHSKRVWGCIETTCQFIMVDVGGIFHKLQFARRAITSLRFPTHLPVQGNHLRNLD
ncbi:hypothetical protein J1N35_025048 [Gossypium stocksii]|uniref:Uncharacterized protein n=1 Tax=Gossypium stocksii TaxID=47602 RepID=A0A9D3ZVU4_9ROSI|nr:hypothetical protein J1N35_025048 [Gossypium stocksii]